MNLPTLFDYFMCVAMISFVIGATMGAVCDTNDTRAFGDGVNVTCAPDISVMTHTAHSPDDAWSQRRGIIMLGYAVLTLVI